MSSFRVTSCALWILKMWTIHHECIVPVLKVCYSRYCSWFTEIDQAFKLNIGNLVRRCWVGICID